MTWLPTILSLSRLPLALLLVIFYGPHPQDVGRAFVIYVLANITDKLDGILARRYKNSSYLGYLVDGLGDRAISIACLLAATSYHHLPLWLACLAIAREFLLSTYRLVDDSWYPPSRDDRRHSLIVFGTSRLWFLILLFSALLHATNVPALDNAACIATVIYAVIVNISFVKLFLLLVRKLSDALGPKDN